MSQSSNGALGTLQTAMRCLTMGANGVAQIARSLLGTHRIQFYIPRAQPTHSAYAPRHFSKAVLTDMADRPAEDDSVRTQTVIWPASTFVTTWTLGSGADTTKSPTTVVPASNSGSSADQSVGPILSGVVVLLVLISVIWFCCRRNRSPSRNSRRSSRRHGSSYTSKDGSSSSGSASSNSSSQNNPSVGSAASEVAEDQWNQQDPMPEGSMPGMPPPVAGGWPGPQPHPGMGPMPPPGPGMQFHPGQGGHMPMMGRGGPPLLGRGGPPPLMGRGGPPPGVM
ncbi:hypothetical protein K449DRAFT_402457 [Hypoxylon sp. EC38]|nr:hypothetical protein K449DRAFT_402457 [Hypoxylon sp. EC38]